MTDIEEQPIHWLWPGRIARGKQTIIAGDPGLGKSSIIADLAARVSTGRPWPDGAANDGPGGVLLIGAEDNLADIVKPRLRVAGADMTREFTLAIAFKAFCRWAVKERRTPENPVAHLARLNDKVDRRRERRPLSPDELARLVAAARGSAETKYGLSRLERSLVYRLATETGLRWSEIRSLARVAFALDADVPSVTVAPEDEKAGRGETLPLRKELADDLAAYFKDHPAKPDAPAFPMNVRNEGAKMVAFDLGRTGDPADVAAEKRVFLIFAGLERGILGEVLTTGSGDCGLRSTAA